MFYWLSFMIFIFFLLDFIFSITEWRPSSWAMTIFSQVIIFGVPCTVYLWRHRDRVKDILPTRSIGIKNVLLVIGMSIAIYPLATVMNVVVASFFDNPTTSTAEGLMAEGGLWLMLVLIPILPSIFEEVMLRGIVFDGYKRVKIFVAALINGLFFGLIHQNFVQFSYAFLVGFFMCYFIYYTKSIWAPILSHFVINIIGVLWWYFATNMQVVDAYPPADYPAYPMPAQGNVALVAIVASITLVFAGVFAVLFQIFKKHNLKRNEMAGVVTDTYADAVKRGETPPKVMTRDLWAFVILSLLLMVFLEIIRMMMV